MVWYVFLRYIDLHANNASVFDQNGTYVHRPLPCHIIPYVKVKSTMGMRRVLSLLMLCVRDVFFTQHLNGAYYVIGHSPMRRLGKDSYIEIIQTVGGNLIHQCRLLTEGAF